MLDKGREIVYNIGMEDLIITSLQDELFAHRFQKWGIVRLNELPTMRQCEMVQAIAPELDYTRLTSQDAQIFLTDFYFYHNKKEIYNVDIVKNVDEVKCPHCGRQNYEVNRTRAICIDVKPIIRDGVMLNRHPDGAETRCTCLACGKPFVFLTQEKRPEKIASKTVEKKSEVKKEVQQPVAQSTKVKPEVIAKLKTEIAEEIKKPVVVKTTSTTRKRTIKKPSTKTEV